MEELRKFQSSTFDTIAKRKLIEDQNTTLELSGRVQELQNEVNCMNDSRDFQDAESVRSGNSHVTSRPVSFPLHPVPEGMLRHSFVSPRRKEGPPSIWDTHGISGTFLEIHMHLHQLLILKHCINGVRGQGDGVPKAGVQQAAADSRGSRTCVCANTFMLRGGTRRGRRLN